MRQENCSRIFLSYRREDSFAHVNGLFLLLRDVFGDDGVFKDTKDIGAGQDFIEVIESQLRTCSVLMAVIGRQWLTVRSPNGDKRRLDEEDDPVRIEVATALRNTHLLVVPILVGGATMPRAADLPPDLRPLSRRTGRELRDSRWESDVKSLIDEIEIPSQLKRAYEAASRSDFDVAINACDRALMRNAAHAEARKLREQCAALATSQQQPSLHEQRRQQLLGSTRSTISGQPDLTEVIRKNLRS